jgi:pimeloyl-ACP methyl ester carboxylesterase
MTVPTSTSTPAPVSASRTVELPSGLSLTITEYGDAAAGKGTGVLLLHGGAGPRTVAGFAAALSEHAYVITPTHPGFDGTPRPDWADSVADLASAYLDLIDVLGLTGVLVIGSSVGGWIGSEMALRDNRGTITALTLINAAGIAGMPGQPGADITNVAVISPTELSALSFHKPEFRPDFASFSEQQRAGMLANQRTLAIYAGEPYMHDPKLRGRLHRVTVPVLALWGEHDGVTPLEYGRAFAAAFPRSRFVPIADSGHFPFIENPGAVFAALGDFIETEVKPDEA